MIGKMYVKYFNAPIYFCRLVVSLLFIVPYSNFLRSWPLASIHLHLKCNNVTDWLASVGDY